MYKLGMLDPTKFHVFFDDFHDFNVGQWIATATSAGVGTSAGAIQNADGGVYKITNAANANDAYFLQWAGVTSTAARTIFCFTAGKKLFFKARFRVDSAANANFVIGLQSVDTTPLVVDHGVYFLKEGNNATLTFDVKTTTATSTDVGTVVDDTWIEGAFMYNGRDAVQCFVGGARVADVVVTNLPAAATILTPSFGVLNRTAAVRTMDVDYIFIAKER
jgi:hypothetical protein